MKKMFAVTLALGMMSTSAFANTNKSVSDAANNEIVGQGVAVGLLASQISSKKGGTAAVTAAAVATATSTSTSTPTSTSTATATATSTATATGTR